MTPVRARWQWQLLTADGAECDRPGSPVFLERFDAEQWLGEHWRALRRQGVARVVLRNGEDDVPPVIDLPGD